MKTVRTLMWNSNYIRLHADLDEFHALTSGPEEPDHDAVRGDWYWPELGDLAEDGDGEGKQPKTHNFSLINERHCGEFKQR